MDVLRHSLCSTSTLKCRKSRLGTRTVKTKWAVRSLLSVRVYRILTFVSRVQLWKYRFSSQCMSVIHDQVFGARTPNYKVLQQLDRKVREFYTPPALQVPGFGGPMTDVDTVPVYLTLQRYVGFAIREMSKLVVNLTQRYALTFGSLILHASRFLCTCD